MLVVNGECHKQPRCLMNFMLQLLALFFSGCAADLHEWWGWVTRAFLLI